MSQWVQIEAAAEPPTAAPPGTAAQSTRPALPASAAELRRRLRRQDRLVVGSLDAAAGLMQRRGREVILGSAIILVPVIALNLLLSTLLFDRFDSFDGSVVSLPELTGGIDAATGVETLLAYISVLTTSLAVALVGGYLAAVVMRDQLGQPVVLRSCLLQTARRMPTLVGAWFVGHVWLFLVAIAVVRTSAEDAAPLAILLVPAGVLVLAIVLPVSPVVMAERRASGVGADRPIRSFRAVRRAMSVSRSKFGASIGFVALAGLLGLGLRFGITLLPRLATSTGLITFGSFGWLAEGVAGQIAQLVSVPLVALATAQFYLQVRIHTEGMDIALAAERAFPGAAPTSPTTAATAGLAAAPVRA